MIADRLGVGASAIPKVDKSRNQKPTTPGTALSWPHITAWRARRHHLDARVPASAMLDVARDISGLHAQVLSSAELSLWARCEGLERHAVRDALWESRTLIKTWAMRGTLHLLPARDWSLWRSAFKSYANFVRDSWLGYFGVTRTEMDRLISSVCEVLSDRPMSRKEVADAVSQSLDNPKLGGKLMQSWGLLLKPAAYLGGLCFGPSRGQSVTFVSPSAWVERSAAAAKGRSKKQGAWAGDDDEAMREIVRRFLAAYGPATRDDLRRWWGSAAAVTKKRIKAIEDELTPVNRSGAQSWMLRSDVGDARQASPTGAVRLLTAFDPYVIAASPHCTEIMSGGTRSQIFRNQGWLSPVLLVDGRMDGIWKHQLKGKRLVVEIAPFKRVAAATRRAANAEAERLAEFLGAGDALEVTWS